MNNAPRETISPGDDISIELAFASAARQELLALTVPSGTTVGEAIERSALRVLFPDEDLATLATGIWGKPVDRRHCVAEGDRIELYRPLKIDPRDARRALAAAGKSMGATRKDR